MKRKLFSILLILCMIFALLPTTALAASVAVKVGGVTLTSTDGSVVYATTNSTGSVTISGATSSNYNVKWDGSTLTLRNAYVIGTGNSCGVSFLSPLTITLVGASTLVGGDTYGINVSGDLTINGGGSLTSMSGDSSVLGFSTYGIRAYSNVTIGGEATVTAVGGSATAGDSSSYGIYATTNVTVEAGARLTAVGGAATGNSAYSYGVSANTINVNGLLVAKGGKVSGDQSYSKALNSVPTLGTGITKLTTSDYDAPVAVYGDASVYKVYEGSVVSGTTEAGHITWSGDNCTLNNVVIVGSDNSDPALDIRNGGSLTCDGHNVVLATDNANNNTSNGIMFNADYDSTASLGGNGNITVIGGCKYEANISCFSYGVNCRHIALSLNSGTGTVVAGKSDTSNAVKVNPTLNGVEAQGVYSGKVYSWHSTPLSPAAANFTFSPPGDLVYDGNMKEATVTANVSGMGKVTRKYYDSTGTLLASAPREVGTYRVKIDVEPGGTYNGAADLTHDSWTFTITAAATVTPNSASYNKSAATAGLTFTLDPGGYTLTAIKNNGTPLVSDADYTVNGNVYTIAKSYLNVQSDGAFVLTFDMSGGYDPRAEIAITSIAPAPYIDVGGGSSTLTALPSSGSVPLWADISGNLAKVTIPQAELEAALKGGLKELLIDLGAHPAVTDVELPASPLSAARARPSPSRPLSPPSPLTGIHSGTLPQRAKQSGSPLSAQTSQSSPSTSNSWRAIVSRSRCPFSWAELITNTSAEMRSCRSPTNCPLTRGPRAFAYGRLIWMFLKKSL